MSSLARTGCRAGAKSSTACFSLSPQPGNGEAEPMGMCKLSSACGGGLCPFLFPWLCFLQPSCPCGAGRMLAEQRAAVPHCGEAGVAQSPYRAWEHHSFEISSWSFQVPLPSGTIVISCVPSVSLGQVKEELMSSIRGAAAFPGLPELPSSPSAANGPVLAQVEGKGLWGPSGVCPGLPHACRCGLCRLPVS